MAQSVRVHLQRPNYATIRMNSNVLFTEAKKSKYTHKTSEGIDDESAAEKKPEEEEEEEEKEKVAVEDDSLVFQVTLIGGIVPLLMLVFSYGVFNSMEAKRRDAKVLLAYDQRPREEDETYGADDGKDVESGDEVADEAGKGPALGKGKKRSAEAPRDGQGIPEMIPQYPVDAPRSREEAPRSKEEAPHFKEDAPISQGDLIGPREPPKPRKGARDKSPEDEDDGYESVDPNAPIPPEKKETKPPPARKKLTKSKPTAAKKKSIQPAKTKGKKTGGKPPARPKRPSSAPPKRRRR
ncbi:hypothetical protein GCK32_015270 [Trichostrongylus colubriformis]|uniref:Uncharacterized protein n=1 Tax=Trichostrongylus colubriformis TaxID=6319 RepID=A0AAN8FMP3_TRICO